MKGRVFLSAVFLLVVGGVSVQAAVITMRPVRASGVEGVDWFLGPGSEEITLIRAGQDVQLKLWASDFAPQTVSGYQATMDCDTLFGSIAGRALSIAIDCTVGEGDFDTSFCIGIDMSEPTYLLITAPSTLGSCQNTLHCPDGDPGQFACGSVAIVGSSPPDAGIDYYLMHWAYHIPEDARGTFELGILDDPNNTFMKEWVKDEVIGVPIEALVPAVVTVQTGACCSLTGSCVADITVDACEALGGTLQPGVSCTGSDSDNDGNDDLCDLCPGGFDSQDSDGDGVPNLCDDCPVDNPDDPDGDGICSADDSCPEGNNAVDEDGDGVPDGCDECPGLDDSIYAPECLKPVPTASTWGLVVLALGLMVLGKVSSAAREAGDSVRP
ncbi:MAG: hypothetical protein ACYTHJ_08770 [Planctomycetota bacterium]|jgi:hypothetical protein